MNSEQRRLIEMVLVIIGCFTIYTYTTALPVNHTCEWTGLIIQDRIGHEVSFIYHNGSIEYYCCVNVSLLAFERLMGTDSITELANIQVRCPMCGMLMDWDDEMIVWVYSTEYLNPTTKEPTIVPLCENYHETEMCEGHFLAEYGGSIIDNPFVWHGGLG